MDEVVKVYSHKSENEVKTKYIYHSQILEFAPGLNCSKSRAGTLLWRLMVQAVRVGR